jgi:hypothetical protein
MSDKRLSENSLQMKERKAHNKGKSSKRWLAIFVYTRRKRKVHHLSFVDLVTIISGVAVITSGCVALLRWSSYEKPKLDIWRSESAIVWWNLFEHDTYHDKAALFDLTNLCFVDEFQLAGSMTALKPTATHAQLLTRLYVPNSGPESLSDLRFGFHSSLGRPIRIEVSPNLAATVTHIGSDYSPSNEVVTIATLPPGSAGIITAIMDLPDSEYSVRSRSNENAMNINYPSSRIDTVFLGAKEINSLAHVYPMNAEDALLRQTQLAGGTTLQLPSRATLIPGQQAQVYHTAGPCMHQPEQWTYNLSN